MGKKSKQSRAAGPADYGTYVQGNQIGGDYVKGDKVGGDKITVDHVSDGSFVQAGKGNQLTYQQGVDGKDLAAIFKEVYARIDAQTDGGPADKKYIKTNVKQVEKEVDKGDRANPSNIRKCLDILAKLAPDIFKILAAALTNPALGVATAVSQVVQVVSKQHLA